MWNEIHESKHINFEKHSENEIEFPILSYNKGEYTYSIQYDTLIFAVGKSGIDFE